MKNYFKHLFQVLLVSLVLFSCSEQDLVVDNPQAEVKTEISSEFSARQDGLPASVCDARIKGGGFENYTGTETIKRAGVNEQGAIGFLLKQRKYVALYRIYAYIYTDYLNRLEEDSNADITREDIENLGLKIYARYYTDYVITAIKKVEATENRYRRWQAVAEYLRKANRDGRVIRTILNRSNRWDDDNSTYGSYGIWFENDYFYVGKGITVDRMLKSAKERCTGVNGELPMAGEYQGTSLKNLNNRFSKFLKEQTNAAMRERQALKEESVKMYLSGYIDKTNKPEKMYNGTFKNPEGWTFIGEDKF